jgi:hypothetical protein
MYIAVPVTAAAAGLGLPPGGARTAPWCGSVAALKKMLFDLGYYFGPIDDNFDADANSAVAAFARSAGVAYRSGVLSDQLCDALATRWETKFGIAAMARSTVRSTATPTMTQALAKRVVSSGAQVSPIDSSALKCAMQGKVWDAATSQCLAPAASDAKAASDANAGGGGTTDPLTACLLAGGQWSEGQCAYPRSGDEDQAWSTESNAGLCAAKGGTWDGSTCVMPSFQEGQGGGITGWWNEQETPVKVAVVGGGVLLVGLVAYGLVRR